MVESSRENRTFDGFSLMELIAVVAIILVMAALSLPALTAALNATESKSCAFNLKQLGFAMSMYSSEQNGKYPTLQRKLGANCDRKNRGTFIFDGPSIYPAYATATRLLVCPANEQSVEEYNKGIWKNRYRIQFRCDFGLESVEEKETAAEQSGLAANPCLIDDSSYSYFPWVARYEWFMDDATMDLSEEFESAMKGLFDRGEEGISRAIEFKDETGNEVAMLPLSEGIQRFLITDVNNPGASWVGGTNIPVIFDRVSFAPLLRNHNRLAGNILFLDGHVEFVKHPSNNYYPLTSAWFEFMTYRKDRYL